MPQRWQPNHTWPTTGPIGYITPATFVVSNASSRGTKAPMPYKWEDGLHHLCRLRGPQRLGAEDKISTSLDMGRFATTPVLHVSKGLEWRTKLALVPMWAP